jgi:hypothetical protein
MMPGAGYDLEPKINGDDRLAHDCLSMPFSPKEFLSKILDWLEA